MDEQFLHYIWKFQKFEKKNLLTIDGQEVQIFDPGYQNYDSGPDFENARLKLANLEWAGQVEIHTQASEWYNHQHDVNPAYETVILHVVWEADKEVTIGSELLPTLELKGRVDLTLLEQYQKHIQTENQIACHDQLSVNTEIALSTMMDRVLVERLESKTSTIANLLKSVQNDWDQVCYQVITTNFGFSVNKVAFGELVRRVPYSILQKTLNDSFQTEALLFGQAGFLADSKDDYHKRLIIEYYYLRKKYDLPEPVPRSAWKYGRIRPTNTPALRVAQLASLFNAHPRLFSLLLSAESAEEIIKTFAFKMNLYWSSRYDFGKLSKKKEVTVGKNTYENLLINSAVPLLAAYSHFTKQQEYIERAVSILEKIRPENNRVTKVWSSINRKAKTAFESQAQIELLNAYCSKRQCLHCNVGVQLLER